MRVAQRMVSRNYMSNLNRSLRKRTDSLDRTASGLKFSKLSDNVADGSRAMHIQEERYQATQQLDNTENLLAEMNSVDGNMESIQSILQNVQEKVLKGMSESYGQTNCEVLAKEIGNLKEEILQFANAQFSGKYLFSGTANSKQPFTVSDEGKIQFNGIEVSKIFKEDGKFYYMEENPDDPANPIKTQVPNSDETYADIGLGLKINTGAQVDPRTAFKVSFSGLDIMGNIPDSADKLEQGDDVSNNVFDLLTQIENAMVPELNNESMNKLHTQLVRLTDNVGMGRTDLGTRMSFLERTVKRLESDIDDMTQLESDLISSDPAEEAINIKQCEYVWMAVLQLGSQILPTSLLDFMS